jgi:hypothetical protein
MTTSESSKKFFLLFFNLFIPSKHLDLLTYFLFGFPVDGKIGRKISTYLFFVIAIE